MTLGRSSLIRDSVTPNLLEKFYIITYIREYNFPSRVKRNTLTYIGKYSSANINFFSFFSSLFLIYFDHSQCFIQTIQQFLRSTIQTQSIRLKKVGIKSTK